MKKGTLSVLMYNILILLGGIAIGVAYTEHKTLALVFALLAVFCWISLLIFELY